MHGEYKKIFDVSRPHHTGPHPTSKPVIVGHQPVNDPMVKETSHHEAHHVPVHTPDKDEEKFKDNLITIPGVKPEDLAKPEVIKPQPKPEEAKIPPAPVPAEPPANPETLIPKRLDLSSMTVAEEMNNSDKPKAQYTTQFETIMPVSSTPEEPQPKAQELVGNDPLPTPRGAGPKRLWGQTFVVMILLGFIIVGSAYAVLKAQLVKNNISLP